MNASNKLLLIYIFLFLGGQTFARLRNVDDPTVDPVEYSKQWEKALETFRTATQTFGFDSMAKRFKTVAQSIELNEECRRTLEIYFRDPLAEPWTLKSMYWPALLNAHLTLCCQ